MRIPCYLEFDERTATVTLRHARTQRVQMKIKLEAAAVNTMSRVNPDEDCDNYWAAFKPADHVVFNDRIFDRQQLIVTSVNFHLAK
jgi:hypothetical protein